MPQYDPIVPRPGAFVSSLITWVSQGWTDGIPIDQSQFRNLLGWSWKFAVLFATGWKIPCYSSHVWAYHLLGASPQLVSGLLSYYLQVGKVGLVQEQNWGELTRLYPLNNNISGYTSRFWLTLHHYIQLYIIAIPWATHHRTWGQAVGRRRWCGNEPLPSGQRVE